MFMGGYTVPAEARVFLSSPAQLGYTKIALALILKLIFFGNHSLRVYSKKSVPS